MIQSHQNQNWSADPLFQYQSQRDWITQPGVARNELPQVNEIKFINLERNLCKRDVFKKLGWQRPNAPAKPDWFASFDQDF
jgi:hypothetical protein